MISWLDRWKKRRTPIPGETTSPVAVLPAVPPAEVVVVDLDSTLRAEFPAEYQIAANSAANVLARLGTTDLEPLARHSPSLAGYDWRIYLQCSQLRVARVMRALSAHVAPGGRVLDYGSYFGNFSTAAAAMGYRVVAVDSYLSYGAALAPWVELQRGAGVTVHDFAHTGYDLETLGAGAYDAVICAGVIEHIAHTPRPLLQTVTSALTVGGVLLLDTPNLAYLYKRLAMVEGRSIFAPIEHQYFTQIPFEGHHREYTVAELEWLLDTAGHDALSIETFNYSVFGQSQLTGEHLAYHREMAADPSLREVIFSVSRRREAGVTDLGH